MKIWTIQPVNVYKLIQETGRYTCDERHPEFMEPFIEAYEWLSNEMQKKIGSPPVGVKFPVWGWHTRNWKHKKPDLRNTDYGTKGQELVCLELEIPDNEVLLSDFDAWHFVLNKWYLNTECFDEKTYDKDEEWLKTLSSEEKEKAIENSWQGIFDLTPVDCDWVCRGGWIQATFWVLKKEYIQKAVFFKNR